MLKGKIRAVFLAFLVLTLLLPACSKPPAQEVSAPPEGNAEATLPEKNETPPEKKTGIDPLTGTRWRRKSFPIGTWRSPSTTFALPSQSGVSQAGVVYEMDAEGGITRLLCIFNDYSVEKIGSVRSARHYFLDYAFSHDPLFIHFGGSPQAYEYIKKTKAQELDGIYLEGSVFYRDKERIAAGYPREHTAFTGMEKILEGAKNAGYSMENKDTSRILTFRNGCFAKNRDQALEVEVPYNR